MSVKENQLPVTIYLNQKIVFDLLAVVEDGFSEMKTLQSSKSSESQESAEIGGEIGLSNVFSLFGIKLKSALGKADSSSNASIIQEERVHTPSSLFSKLLDYLYENEMIKEVDTLKLNELETGNFISFKGTLKENPLKSMLDSFEQLGVMAIRLSGKKKNQDKDVLKQIKAMKESLEKDDMIDLVSDISNTEDVNAVIPVYNRYFFNRNKNEIIEGEYTILGKVARVILDEDKSINLLRNTGFQLFQKNVIKDMFDQMNNSAPSELDIPDLSTQIYGPALLIIPIAIYL